MLVWLIAASAPRIIDRIEMKTMICRHSVSMPWNGPTMTRRNRPVAAIFGATAKKAVTGVGAPS